MTAPNRNPEPAASQQPAAEWGAAPPASPAPKPRSARSKWIAGGVAVVIVAGGGAAVWAGTSSSSSGTAGGGQAGPGGQPGGVGGPGGGAGLGSALHGEFVTSDNGTYVTKFLQTGEVTELSSTSLTTKSTDGFTKTYTIDSATVTGITKGESVTVVATESGSTATATSVTEAGSGMDGG
ncbi:hypothetical protein [Amycolatopsis panacis]|uniref:DUF5666 domain-containing protein n=1 Tax=Amycolatopsis panacis TaxID=2340917 RepID=A0A419HMF3_9PSEU|nr:hypothetical protein [Amycolatopsis panacis]RJQ77174.1 hypothetical protein D5S19_29225 [Amycolatopsis panacis]